MVRRLSLTDRGARRWRAFLDKGPVGVGERPGEAWGGEGLPCAWGFPEQGGQGRVDGQSCGG